MQLRSVMLAAALVALRSDGAWGQPQTRPTADAAPSRSAEAVITTEAIPTEPPAASDRSSPVERANADAVARLYAQIAAERVGDSTVDELLGRVSGREAFRRALADAEQVGGPRHLADDLVQVQLRIDGARAATLVLNQLDGAGPDRAVPRERIAADLRPWAARSFRSTGDSAGRASDGFDPIGERSDRVAPGLAPAALSTPTSTSAATAPLDLPARAPAWASEPITAAATAPSAGAPLLTARAAERQARDLLLAKARALRLSDSSGLGDFAQSSAARGEAFARALAQATIAGVDYRADGSVEVRLALDGQRLWQTLQLAPR